MKFVVSESKLGVVVNDEVHLAKGDHGADPLGVALAEDVDLFELATRIVRDNPPQAMPERLDPPVRRPSKIMAMGLNYRDHCRESGTPLPESPIEFTKHPSSLTGHMHPIPLDESLSTEVDYEVELAVIIGRRCRDLEVANALDVVAGYSVSNDVSARELQIQDGQWVRAKSFDGFTPLGPVFVTADEITDPQDLPLQTRLDGELLQDSSTNEMVFTVAELLAFVSRRTTLEPGDILLTGTPHGCGAYRDPQVFLTPGSTVACTIAGIGTLTNPVVAYD
jgi:2-keto-4-pentenoate hydratase/2-oxohepta-3-ene-1,7-dioic acid hydratase in catechol pathway